MTIVSLSKSATLATALLASTAVVASVKDVTISVWSGGSGPNDNYRVDAIEIAADLLEREAAIVEHLSGHEEKTARSSPLDNVLAMVEISAQCWDEGKP